jgi:hypothetical protein
MNDTKREAVRMILVRRVRGLIKERNLQAMTRPQMYALTSRLTNVVGEYISDCDLWTMIRLTQRGLFQPDVCARREQQLPRTTS